MAGNKGKHVLNNIKLDHWVECWKTNKLIWQMDAANPFLCQVAEKFKPKSNVLIPLCGKTVDMVYLADQGHSVVGTEYTKKGVEEFFGENCIKFNTITSNKNKDLTLYEAVEKDIKIYQGNMFHVRPGDLAGSGQYDVIWDRGSFVAMHVDDRPKYTGVMKALARSNHPGLDYFMEAFVYDEAVHGGPPFNAPREVMDENWADCFDLALLHETDGAELAERLEIDHVAACYYLLKLKQAEK